MARTTEVETARGPAATDDPSSPLRKSTLGGIAWAVFGFGIFAFVVFVSYNLQSPGQMTARVANPNVTGAPRPVAPLFGDTAWLTKMQLGTIAMVLVVVVAMVVMWRRYPRHPVLLCAIACTAIVWMDPLMNWSPYVVYNPQLWHLPNDWLLVRLAPVIEPLVVLGYVTFYLGPFFPAIWILRRLQAKRGVESFSSRHPLVSLAVLVYVIGFVYDALLEIFCVRAGLYIYSQVIPFGSVFTGKAFQFPLLWESSLVTLVMIPAAILVYRDDTGKTVAEKLAQRLKLFARRPALATFLMIFIILQLAYASYGLGFAVIRWTKMATSVACPFPYPEAKTYDPNGFYAKNGQPGPYSPGNWDAWMSAQPNGRPDVPTNPDGRCSPQNVGK
jgi:hypothetical protein